MNIPQKEIEHEIIDMGFDPILIKNHAGYEYSKHTHKETKLLVFLKGSMSVKVEEETYACEPGDLILIDGNTVHSAVVGPKGCEFYWSEKVI